MSDAVIFGNVDIVFGDNPQRALDMVDQGKTRDEIGAETGLVLGVAGASLSVQEGEILVLMGLSGSGKSTLLRAVNGLAPVVRGNVGVKTDAGFVDPYKASASVLRDLRMHTVSMVFQQFGLLPWRTVAENVGFGLELAGVPDAEREKTVATQLELVNLSKWANRKVQELSGGMQQRVGLARALSNDADILLMDEAYSALDPLIRVDMQSVLLDLQKELKKTVVFITHDLDEALRLGDRIAILRDGEVIQQPADDYISAFVKEVNRGRVIMLGTIMSPSTQQGEGLQLPNDMVLETAARMMTEARQTSANVVDEAGKPVGHVDLQQIIGAMVTPKTHEDNQIAAE